MVTRLEKEQLVRNWKDQPRHPAAAIAKCAAGLLVLVMLAHFGSPAGSEVAIPWANGTDTAQRQPG